ncbi:type VI secretion protein IcmF/TssM N-terminal domain-containing protein, partial [Glaciimonas soli]
MTNPASADVVTPVSPPPDVAPPAADNGVDDAALQEQEKLAQEKTDKEAQEAAQKKKEADAAADTKKALTDIDNAFERTLSYLQSRYRASGLQKFSHLWKSKRYLYDRPWFMMLGVPNAGKSAAARHTGLGTTLNIADYSKAYAGWLSEQAMLIEPASRYMTQAESRDGTEWHHLLDLLRKHRPRAPINAAIVTINIADLLQKNDGELLRYSAQLSTRLHELRTDVGSRFPIYVVITKMDVVQGFSAYFDDLTADERAKSWGFSLLYEKNVYHANNYDDDVKTQLQTQFTLLDQHLQANLPDRLQQTFEKNKRRALSVFPQEFTSLIAPLVNVIGSTFANSHYDNTEHRHSLRGVYFTSMGRDEPHLSVNPLNPLQRQSSNDDTLIDDNAEPSARQAMDGSGDINAMYRNIAVEHNPLLAQQNKNTYARDYFLSDLFNNIIIPEAHLVQPNLQHAFGLRLRRWLAHGAVAVLGCWLLAGLLLSSGNNTAYLKSIADKTTQLTQRIDKLFAASPDDRLLQVPDVLTAAQELPQLSDLDVESPSTGFHYGLYTVTPVVDASHIAYQQLEDRFLLPQIEQRLQAVLVSALQRKDTKTVYDTLRVVLQLHDKNHFNAKDIKTWVMQDWSSAGGSAAFGGRTTMVHHLNALFSGERVVQSALPQNADLVQQAR